MAEINPMLLFFHMEKKVKLLKEIREHFSLLSSFYIVDLDEDWENAEYLMLDEGWFFYEPSFSMSKDLDDRWSKWAFQVFRHLEDGALDLNFSHEQKYLQDFLKSLSTSRTEFF